MSKLGKDNRLWRSPRHHLDSNDSDNYVHWVELFFDLIHVVMVFILGNYLADHQSLEGVVTFVILFVAVWLAWSETSVYNSIYVSSLEPRFNSYLRVRPFYL